MHKIYPSQYKDIDAITLESDLLQVQFLPKHGGKMASFVYKETAREFLVQAPELSYKALQFAGKYTDAECSGFDDMFPTIDSMTYSDYPWQGVEMADHGEVCGLPWEVEIGADDLLMSVYGVRFPYKLEKRIRFESEHVLRIDYRAINLSPFDFDFLWAAHPMIDTRDGVEILVPYEGQQEARCIFSSDPQLGAYGDLLTWPETLRKDGKMEKLAVMMPEKTSNSGAKTYKFFFKERLPEGWCAFRYTSEGTVLRFSFPEEKVPYLGIWTNNKVFKDFYNIALEMCTGSMDRPDLAKLYQQNSILRGNSEYHWYLKLQVDASFKTE
jgi:hypothetical protein